MKRLLATGITACLVFITTIAYPQGVNNNWCFGTHDGLNFNNGSPVVFYDSITSVEGCAAASDLTGNLLFYASPEKVWDRGNNIMPNGSGLLGTTSATQGAAIIQSFTNPNQYYLFTIMDTIPHKLAYSVIDMSLNGGYGDVIPAQKNILLDSNVSEKMVIVRGDSTCTYVWLLVHAVSNHVFYAFRIDAAGINPTPVVSNSGFFTTFDSYRFGEMKVSVKNNLVLANLSSHSLELDSINVNTGIVSGAALLDTNNYDNYYGVAYSPDGSKLYVGLTGGNVLQYDVSLLPDINAAYNSKTVLGPGTGGLRLGPDGRIYGVNGVQLNVINNPNLPGVSCGFVPNAITLLSPPGSTMGSDVVLNAPNIIKTRKDTAACFEPGTFTINAPPGYSTYLWSDGTILQSDTFSSPGVKWVTATQGCTTLIDTFVVSQGIADTTISVTDTSICFVNYVATLQAPTGYTGYLWSDGTTQSFDTFGAAGTKWVTAANGCSMLQDTFHVSSLPINTTTAVTDTTICLVNITPVFSGQPGYTSYLWSDGKTTLTDTMAVAGVKWVNAQTGCNKYVDTFHLHAAPILTTTSAIDTNICFVNNIPILSGPPGYNTYTWSDGFTIQQDTSSAAGTKWVMAQTGCVRIVDTFHLHDWRDTSRLVKDTSLCVAYSPIPLFAPGGYTSYAWSDGATTQGDTFFSSTTKWVKAINGCNLFIDTIHFTATTIPPDSVSTHGYDTSICVESFSMLTINGPTGYTYYLWNDGITLPSDTFTTPGTKWVYAQRGCYLLIDTFAVHTMAVDTSIGSRDTIVCFSTLATVPADEGYLSYAWNDGATTQSDTFSTTAVKWVNMHKACIEVIDTFHVRFVNDLAVSLGNDTSICKGQSLTLNAGSALSGVQYLWQDNSSQPAYTVTQGGLYSVQLSVGPCAVSDTILVHQKVIASSLGDSVIPCGKQELLLDPKVGADVSVLWQNGSTAKTFNATKEGVYWIKLTEGDCSSTDTTHLKKEPCNCIVVMPNAFSPNNDGRNDWFGPKISCDVSDYKFMIYDRWGNQVFYSESKNELWDGSYKKATMDGNAFYYYLQFRDDKQTMNYYEGDVTVVR
jgi:gliding motility-associated-like protein